MDDKKKLGSTKGKGEEEAKGRGWMRETGNGVAGDGEKKRRNFCIVD